MKLTEWKLKRQIDELSANVLGSSYTANTDIALLKSRVNHLEEIPPGGVTSYNDLTDKPTIPTLDKENVEAVLTGEISTHTHAGGSGISSAQSLAIGLL